MILQHPLATLFSRATDSQVKRASGATTLNGNTKKIKEQSLQDDTGLASAVRVNLMVHPATIFLLSLIQATKCTVVLISSYTAAVQRETLHRGVSLPPKR